MTGLFRSSMWIHSEALSNTDSGPQKNLNCSLYVLKERLVHQTQSGPMLQEMRRLYPRGAANRGISVDVDGAMLGPDCVLASRTPHGFRALERESASTVQKCVLEIAADTDWLLHQCRRIADALNEGEFVLAQIYGLHIPAKKLNDQIFRRLARISFSKAGFNPDEPRIPKGDPHGGEWTTGGDSDGSADISDDFPDDALSLDNASSTVDATGQTSPTNTTPVAFFFPGDPQGRGVTEQPTDEASDVSPVAYPGGYHAAVVQALKDHLTQNGGVVITGVTLNAINGTTAVADMIVKLPDAPPFIVEVKTGLGA